jgi:tRNA pseudouridine38-40 synthase
MAREEPAADRVDGDAVRRRRIERTAGAMRAFRIAYDGTPFRGFQRQPDVSTVEDALFDALRTLDVFDDASDARGPDRPPGYAAAGRTDAGVSALAQTVAFVCPDWLTPRALNAELPASIRAWASVDVDPDFHATHDATRRAYTYCLHAPATPAEADPDDLRSPQIHDEPFPTHIDDDRVRDALSRLAGRHDFHNLTPDDEGTVRDLEGAIERDGDFLLLRVESDGFPREFVRRLVTLLRQVGTGAADPSFVERVLDPAPLSGRDGIGPATPAPLVLTGVDYPDCEFARDPEAAAGARERFGSRQSRALSKARVAALVRAGIGSGDGDSAAPEPVE